MPVTLLIPAFFAAIVTATLTANDAPAVIARAAEGCPGGNTVPVLALPTISNKIASNSSWLKRRADMRIVRGADWIRLG
ncbi:hypothetical protein ABVK25_009688 [Lepraria finkii]|uniref:Uncharacterized protein n=1 Tax=Lepraria finkii TaxID=1340010 RepID=A0ABR4B2S5_9LECA